MRPRFCGFDLKIAIGERNGADWLLQECNM